MDDADSQARLTKFTARRTIKSPVETLWKLWCTRGGLESWWAPEGTLIRVLKLEPKKGGRVEFAYSQAAAVENPEWASRLESEGHSSRWEARGRFSEVRLHKELSFFQDLEFGKSGREIPYSIHAQFESATGGTRVTLTARSLRTKHWALLGKANLSGQLERLAARAESKGTQ